MAETMVEKVARVIADNAGDGRDYTDVARAAIDAMREPTERMISEGESAAKVGIGKCCDDEALPRVWHWMIDAALAEKADG